MAQGWRPQWNSDVAMAVRTASWLSEAEVPGGGLMKKLSGSADPKNMRPMPMPALNIIAIQDTVRNWGSSSSAPSLMRPYLLAASQMTKTTKKLAASTKSQPVFWMTQPSADEDTEPRLAVLTKPQITKPTASAAVTPNTRRSRRGCSGA